jgi:hypothetical protein
MIYPDTITFDADGEQHEATVGLPTVPPGPDAMVRWIDGIPYRIYIGLAGPHPFIARPIEGDYSV